MSIKSLATEFEITGFPQYVDVEAKLYEIEKVNRLRDVSGSSLVIIYREKNNGGSH